jgi:membrane associated rhomboid family serine protease
MQGCESPDLLARILFAMIVIPYSTDAPLYHIPFVTGGIILANTVIFFATTFQVMLGFSDLGQIEGLMLEYNQINPVQWITSNFMHGDLFHLLGNMFFLFIFGLIVEGKLGNMRFLGLYAVMCLLDGAASQVPMYFLVGEGTALGASGVIYGLMAIAVIWAPENEVDCFYWLFFFFYGTAEVSILTLGGWFIGLEIFSLIFSGFQMSSALLHMIGVAIGAPLGFYLLRKEMIDCEGWDIVSRNDWLKQYPLLYGPKQRRRDQDKNDEVEDPVATALAMTGGNVANSKRYGLAGRVKKTTTATPQPQANAKAKASPLRRRKKRPAEQTSEKLAEKARAHPEFNRLAYMLRQSLDAQNIVAAQQTFLRLDSLKLSIGLHEKTLFRYADALGRLKRWTDAIRPLAIVVEQQGTLADDGALRLAQIQLRILKRPDHAIRTLEKIQVPEGDTADEAKHRKLAKRDELLRIARGNESTRA